ncbi:hypothetical protein [Pararhizobium sp.]|uniref:hypothetical protein n=1 Tax=Pararhizobium sp. TaxID=1977563 RepID=UPI003D0D2866
MGCTYIPEPWKPYTAVDIEDTLGKAILHHIDSRGLGTKDIRPRYKSIRKAHIDALRRGEPLGFRMCTAIIEALGLPIHISVGDAT